MQRPLSTAGCQMSLAPRSALWLSALSIQGKTSTLRLGAHDNAAKSNACSVVLGDAIALHSLLVYVHDCAFVNAVFGES